MEILFAVVFTISCSLFLFYCVLPYYQFYKAVQKSEQGSLDQKRFLKQNPRYRVLKHVLEAEQTLWSRLDRTQKLRLLAGKYEKKVKRHGENLKVVVGNGDGKVKIKVYPDRFLGRAFTVEGSEPL